MTKVARDATRRSAPGAPALEVQDLRIALPPGGTRDTALQGPSIGVDRGEVLAVVGESGAGKSSLALAVLGLLPPALAVASGRILLEGEDIVRAAPGRLRALRGARMSMIQAQPATALDPLMTCGEQIDEVLRRRTSLARSARRDKALALLQETRLADPARIAASRPHQLPDGQRQRVLIAMALALDPVLLVADEPTHALDAAEQAQILTLLRELCRRRGAGMLFTTRDIRVAAEVAQRLAVLHEGTLVESGARDELLERAQHEPTRRMLAAFAAPPRERAPDPHAALVLRVQDLSRTYVDWRTFGARHEVHALRAVSLEVRRGQTLAVVGASGAGKSTLARCIARLDAPSAGSIRLGRDEIARVGASHLRPLRRRMQLLSGDPQHALNPRRTVGESMLEGPLNFGMPRELAHDRARDLLEMAHLPAGTFDHHPDQLDDDARLRVCIARALVVEPELLVADEPVAALDPTRQSQLLELLDEMQRRLHFALLFVTRDLRAAVRLCDQLAVLHDGELVEQGATRKLLQQPQHACTRALVAAAAGGSLAFER